MAGSIHKFTRYTEVLMRYNVLISGQLQYVVALRSWRYSINHLISLFFKTVGDL
jgi:hypothetical protein